MAYKQKGCTPITAKLQKTTRGGMVQQPLLNMGSPAKQGSKNANEARKAANQKRSEFLKQQKATENKASYEKKLEGYKKTTSALESGKLKGRDKAIASRKASQFSNELFNYDKKNNPSRTEGYKTAGDYAKSKINKVNKPEVVTTPKVNKPEVVTPDNKTGKMAKAGSAERKAQYDAKGWKYDETIAGYNKAGKEIQKSVSAITPKKTVSIENKASKAEIKTTKTAPKAETNTRKEIKSAREAFRAGDITKKQKKAIIGEEKAMQKDARADKKAERIAKRVAKKNS